MHSEDLGKLINLAVVDGEVCILLGERNSTTIAVSESDLRLFFVGRLQETIINRWVEQVSTVINNPFQSESEVDSLRRSFKELHDEVVRFKNLTGVVKLGPGVDIENPTKDAHHPMIMDSWRYGFNGEYFGFMDNGPFVPVAVVTPIIEKLSEDLNSLKLVNSKLWEERGEIEKHSGFGDYNANRPMPKLHLLGYIKAIVVAYETLRDSKDYEYWTPIELVPMDGTVVDLWHNVSGRETEMVWNGRHWYCTKSPTVISQDESEGFTHFLISKGPSEVDNVPG